MKMKCYGVIMAGGGGTRFWPLSRQKTPKQLLNLSGRDLMINETIERIADTILRDDIFIVTNKKQADKMKKSVEGRVNKNHVLAEPAARNTAACIGYAALEIVKKHEDGIMCIFPSDHFIKNQKEFTRILKNAIEVAENHDKLVTIGIKPTFPATGYGYIKFGGEDDSLAKQVIEFKEKPDYEKAVAYIKDNNYVWNSGMFIWKASTILKKFEEYLPEVYQYLLKIGDSMNTKNETKAINKYYPLIPSVSIDYGIMEKSSDVLVIPGEFGWNDVGSWDMLDALYDRDVHGNIIHGEQVNIDTTNCISYSSGKLIATIGVDNVVVVETQDAILVCNKDRVQNVKLVVDTLKEQGKVQYL